MSVRDSIIEKLVAALQPSHLTVDNESHKHNVPANSETHFKVTVVAESLQGLSPVKRHQAIYGAVSEELAGPVHALAIHAYTPEEWPGESPDTPNCLGGGAQ